MNMRNMKRSRRNKSGVTGVRWDKASSRWHVQIGDGRGKNRHVGLFTDFEQAVAARKSAETKAGFHPNHGRAPKQMEV